MKTNISYIITAIIFSIMFASIVNGDSVTPYSSPYGSSIKYLNISHEILCPGNVLIVTAKSGSEVVDEVNINAIRVAPNYGSIGSNTTNLTGQTKFILKREGDYEIEGAKVGFQKPNSIKFSFTFCKEEKNITQTNITQPPESPKNETTIEIPQEVPKINETETVQQQEEKPKEVTIEQPKVQEQPKITEETPPKQEEKQKPQLAVGFDILAIAIIAMVFVIIILYKLFKTE